MSKLIYIVEDSEIIRELISRSFSKRIDCTVKSFGSGEDMLIDFSEETPNLIVLDYYLDTDNKNAMNGEEVLIKIQEKNKDIPIFIISGLTDQGKINELMGMGVKGFIDKDSEDVFAKIEEVADKFL